MLRVTIRAVGISLHTQITYLGWKFDVESLDVKKKGIYYDQGKLALRSSSI